eukprot:TRINITY_DN5348_c0_g1_i1.p1 TRINITY_DN5348_c0_g1~~TRINITY_DN5348_c0_g1_i1.p1  ORF type:complete len:148 (-),score=16.35 TRINITY_DN5348_c0_g1_i1:333-776(-)
MAKRDGKKVSQSEMLEILSPPPFNQRRTVPDDAIITYSPQKRWWRSDSPQRSNDAFADQAPRYQPDPTLSMTAGSLGFGKRNATAYFMTASQVGPGRAAHFENDPDTLPTISGFSAHYPGKAGGNIIGTTFNRSLTGALAHTRAVGK